MVVKKKHEVDMLNGPILPRALEFAFPLMLSSLLQLLYNAADIVVVGRFAGPQALAAVGSTGSLAGLIVNAFMGLSTGASVLVARHYGGGRQDKVHKTVHSSMTLALICGTVVSILGLLLSGKMLRWMDSPPDVLPLATQYLQIYFMGSIANLVYNFGAGILRAIGDTKRPLYYLAFSGLVNVLLNLVLVIVFHMGAAGVGIATVASQVISAVLVVMALLKADGCYRLDLRELCFDLDSIRDILVIGVPTGLQSVLFTLSNVLIQSTNNSYGSTVIAGNSAGANLEGFLWVVGSAFAQTCMTFCSQNLGAGKKERLDPILHTCLLWSGLAQAALSIGALLIGDSLIGFYSTEPQVVAMGLIRIGCTFPLYFTTALMETASGFLRGMGRSFQAMLISLAGVCGLRILWLYTVFPMNPTLETLYISYPVSWAVTALAHYLYSRVLKREMARKV